ncbi:hypothetical protein HYH03_001151 [Edaphochlamys debaryana]|uniref:Uncharacterized protein n=1 Tax=Edaphochlamys debaryana TaxID=47281 RepID=A0A835YF30_9CHLO|nr:hypothetical protein HYH03_001151 [Edaphochlamys debaryana]|eukprot:KAG2501361.1 hypothetical protein HYH03_001151 [Edaphochlamys debaryana]
MNVQDSAMGTPACTKRRPLGAAPSGQGPPANPVPAVLFNPTLLAKIRPVGAEEVAQAQSSILSCRDLRKSLGTFRLVSKDARAAFDGACEAPLVYGPQRQRYGWGQHGAEEPVGPSPSQALGWALGMLRRGRRPRAVHIKVDERIFPDGWRQGGLDLLQAIPQLSGRPGEGVASLELPAQLLSPSAAALIAGTFPNLNRLELSEAGKLSPDASHESARGLALLLGAASGAESGEEASTGAGGEEAGGAEGDGVSGGTGGEEAGGAPAPLLSRLTALSLSEKSKTDRRLPPGFASVLRQAPQLRTLELPGHGLSRGEGQEEDDQGPVEELASLTQLTALSLHSCAVPLLPVLTSALTRLTSLELSGQREPLPAALFAPLQGLQRLEIPCATLEVLGLAGALSSLTRLSVGGFTLPAQELSQPLTGIPRWRLPAGLRELGISPRNSAPAVPPEVLAGLELPAGLRLDQASSQTRFALLPGRHTAPPVGDDGFAGTELLPAAEEALCGALRFVLRHGLLGPGSLSIAFYDTQVDRHLQPVGGAANTGPGRPNHGRWLRELGALGPSRLWLEGIQLSYQDVEAIRDGLQNLDLLRFELPSKLPLPALPLLAGLPRLEDLALDASPWAGDDPASSELRGQALASIVALARALPDDRRLKLNQQCATVAAQAGRERVRQMGLRAEADMEAWGVDRISLFVDGWYVQVDPGADD